MKNYILNGHDPELCSDPYKWGAWFETADRKVALDNIGDAAVSTVFLSVDHSFMGEGPPTLFETMVFGGELDQEQGRYGTWREAEIGHAAMCERVRALGSNK